MYIFQGTAENKLILCMPEGAGVYLFIIPSFSPTNCQIKCMFKYANTCKLFLNVELHVCGMVFKERERDFAISKQCKCNPSYGTG